MATFSTWLAEQGAADNPEVLNSRGEQRKEYLMAYMVWQARERKAKQSQQTKRVVGNTQKKERLRGWFPYEKLSNIVGKSKLDKWIDAKVIESKADERTGDDAREMCD